MFSRLLRLFYAQKRYYRSDIQNYLDDFDTQNPLSQSQRAEIHKHQPIHKLRDTAKAKEHKQVSWLDDDRIK